MNRTVTHLQAATPAQDGAGVKLKRIFPAQGLDNVDPFLLLDHFGSDNPDDFVAGFPMHPHRGMETVSYMLKGSMHHKDSQGNSGTIGPEAVQWMSAGRGIMHEEMPQASEDGLDGMQLWVNLAAKDKMGKAAYQEYKADRVTSFDYEGHHVRLVSGTLLGHEGVVTGVSTQPLYAEIRLQKGGLSLVLPETHNAFVYVFAGEVKIEGALVKKDTLAVLGTGDTLRLDCDGEARLMLAAGKPINEPIVRSGPFVMNTEQEINETWDEIRAGTFPPA